MPASRSVFGPDFLTRLRRLPKHLAPFRSLAFQGERTSVASGGGVEFRGHRPYTPGDDPRKMDWNAYARLRRCVVKEFASEVGPKASILVDSSRSMRLFGKDVAASRLAATIAYLVMRCGGTARLALLHPGGANLSRPFRGDRGSELSDALEFLSSPPAAARGERLEGALREGLRAADAHGSIFVISDFWLEPGAIGIVARASALGREVVLVHVLAPAERDPARARREGGYAARVLLVDSETGAARAEDLEAASSGAYSRALDRHVVALRTLAARHRLRYRFVGAETALPEGALPLFLPVRRLR